MYSLKSYRLTKDEYNYLLPVLRKKLSNSNGNYYFCGDTDKLVDMLSRLKGLYNYFDSYNGIIDYKCAKNCSLEPFRDEMKSVAQYYTQQVIKFYVVMRTIKTKVYTFEELSEEAKEKVIEKLK